MGNNDTMRNMLIAAVVFVLAMAIGNTLLPSLTPPTTPGSGDQVSPTGTTPVDVGVTTAQTGAQTDESPVQTGITPAAGQPATAGFTVVEADEELKVNMGAAPDAGVDKDQPSDPYRMRLSLSNVGASVDTATLTDHRATLDATDRYTLLAPLERPDGTTYRSFAIEKVNIDGADLTLHDKRWQAGEVEKYRTAATNSAAETQGQRLSFWIEIHQDGAPAVKLTQTFTLPQQAKEDGRRDLWSTITATNLSAEPHRVVLTYRGGLGVPISTGRMAGGRMIDIGVRDETGQVAGERTADNKITSTAGTRMTLYKPTVAGSQERLSWAAIGNTYFTCTIAPVGPDGRTAASYISEVSARDLDGNSLTEDDASLSLVTTQQEIEAGGKLTYRAALYLGEKDARSFRDEADYTERNYYYQITQSFGACTFTFLVEVMIWLLNSLFFVFHDFGVAIIILVLIVRVMLHPITKKGQVNMVRMQKQMGEFAPKVEEIKKKYGNDKARIQQETMKLYREHGINPAGQMMGCIPLFIQMPIWIALFLSLSNNVLMRHEPFHFTWIYDLTAQDALIPFSTPLIIPFFGIELTSFNLLPPLVSEFLYVQTKTQPRPKPNPNATDQQRQQQEMMQKMMPMMSIMMLFFFYKMPAGLNLYIMCSSMFGWIEQIRIRKHIKEQEENGTFGKPPSPKDGPPPKPRGLSWLQRLQKAAEEAQKTKASKRTRTKPRR